MALASNFEEEDDGTEEPKRKWGTVKTLQRVEEACQSDSKKLQDQASIKASRIALMDVRASLNEFQPTLAVGATGQRGHGGRLHP